MNFQQRINAFVQLGEQMRQLASSEAPELFNKAYTKNNWFTPSNIQQSFLAWSAVLTEAKLNQWLLRYTITENSPKKIAIIAAGNIPLVGLHDVLCVLIAGHIAIIKPSDDDKVLMEWALNQLILINPDFKKHIEITESRLPSNFDAVIATGSNNTNRYFEYYFRNKPSLLRKNRNSVAVLTGNETPEDIQQLSIDIFTYFGLGCRNISKLYVPQEYDLPYFLDNIESNNELINHHKYANNYNYHKAILLMNLAPHLDNNFLLLKEDTAIASPLGMLFYEKYADIDSLMVQLKNQQENIQCILSKVILEGALPLGKSQMPELWDYADGVDTMDFLLNTIFATS